MNLLKFRKVMVCPLCKSQVYHYVELTDDFNVKAPDACGCDSLMDYEPLDKRIDLCVYVKDEKGNDLYEGDEIIIMDEEIGKEIQGVIEFSSDSPEGNREFGLRTANGFMGVYFVGKIVKVK